jgi:hypothetical protein
MKRLIMVGLLFLIGAAAFAAPKAPPDPVVGTWTLNAAKSTMNPHQMFKSQIRTYRQSKNGITLVVKTTLQDGKASRLTTTYQYDGKPYPVIGTTDWDSLSAKRIDEYTAEFVLLKDGKTVGTTSRTVSKDGKTLLVTEKATNMKGESTDSTLTFEK